MFTAKKRRYYRFNPFNLKEESEDNRPIVKFDRLPQSIKPRPLWVILMIFLLVLLIYMYIKDYIA